MREEDVNGEMMVKNMIFSMESPFQVLQEIGKIHFSLSEDKFTSLILNIKIYFFVVNILLFQIK